MLIPSPLTDSDYLNAVANMLECAPRIDGCVLISDQLANELVISFRDIAARIDQLSLDSKPTIPPPPLIPPPAA